jgi:hypothetical protein
MMNAYNPTLALAWRANTDLSPCTSVHSVLNYVAKYATKDEPATGTYKELADRIAPFINESQVREFCYK